jgi:hypothetical protein
VKKAIYLFLVISLGLGSCQKEKTKTELLTEKSWLTTAIKVNPGIPIPGDTITITDLLAQYEPCVKDNLFKFALDTKYSEEEGAARCNASDTQIVKKGTWSFNTRETILTVISSDTTTYNLLELNATTLKVSKVETLQGTKYTLSYVLTAQ